MISLGEIVSAFPPAATRGMNAGILGRPAASLTHRPERLAEGGLFACFGEELPALPPGQVVLARKMHGGELPLLIYPDLEKAARGISLKIHAAELARVRLVGVTGTNGKSTVVEFCRRIFERMRPGLPAASLGTLGLVFAGRSVPTPNTTLFPLDLHPLIAEASLGGCRIMFMEVSSHSLAQGRVEGLSFGSGAVTNITRDHLDFHKTEALYIAAKRRLMDMLSGPAVVNADSENCAGFTGRHGTMRYGLASGVAELRLLNPLYREDGIHGELSFPGTDDSALVILPFYGRHNAENALAAIGLCLAEGLDFGGIVGAIESLRTPRGRLEQVPLRLPGRVYIDYAHTPDGIGRVIEAIRSHFPKNRLRLLFGCGGDRDRGKRPMMGELAARMSDEVIVTSDNPRTERPEAIIADILGGMNGGVRPTVIADRRAAIREALSGQRDNDILLLAGKGHEDYQVIGKEKIHFDEIEICKEYERESENEQG